MDAKETGAAARICSALFSVCLPIAAQQTIQVGGASGVSSIPAAIAMAQPGDTIVVGPGIWPADFTVDKGIAILGDGAQLTRGPFGPFVIDVANVPAGQTFVLRGFDTDAAAASDLSIDASNCAGRLLLQELGMNGFNAWRLSAIDVAQLQVAGVVARSFVAANCSTVVERLIYDPGLTGLVIQGGRAVFDSCSLNAPSSGFGGPALWIQDAQVALTRSTVTSTGQTAAIGIGSGTLLLDPSCSVSVASGPTISGGGVATPFELTTLTTRADAQELTIDQHGRAGDGFVTVAGLPGAELPTPLGIAWIDPASLTIAAFGAFGASRRQVDTVPLAALPPLPAGLTLVLQTVTFAPGGDIGLGSPSLVTLP
jgi:hypothetical protein